MKKIFFAALLFIISFSVKGQFPSFPYNGNSSTGFGQNSAISSKIGFLWYTSFADTTELNNFTVSGASAGFLKNIAGFTARVVNDWYMRSNDLQSWVKMNGGGGGGSGTVTNFTAGNLSPLFTTSVATSTTTPALTFAQVSQSQNLFYASPNGSSGVPSFRGIVGADLPDLNTLAWKLTGNSGTTAGTNFIGTTDNVGLVFKTNNVQSGFLDRTLLSTSFGYQSLLVNAGVLNTAFGYRNLVSNTSGVGNTAIGNANLNLNTSGGSNIAIGASVLATNVSGSDNIGIGRSALATTTVGQNIGIGQSSLQIVSTGQQNLGVGTYSGAHMTTESNRIFLNTLDRTDKAGDTTKSIIYGAQDATASNQRLYLNSQLYLPYTIAQNNAADSMLVVLPSTGKVGYRAIPTSSGGTVTGTGTLNFVPKWNNAGGTALGNSLIYDDGTNIGINNSSPLALLHVGSQNVTNSVDPAILASRSLTGSGNSHAFADATNFAKNLNTAYNSFDARCTIAGSVNYDHYAGFQCAPIFSNTATMTNLYGYYFKPSFTGSGTITNNYGMYVANLDPISGTITNNYGLYIETLSRGGTNYAVYTSGTAKSVFGGAVTSTGLLNANAVGGNLRLKADGTTAKDGGIFANSGGDIYFSNWDGNRGFYIKSTGELQTLSTIINFGGSTSSFPRFTRNGAIVEVKLADNSGYTTLGSGGLFVGGSSLNSSAVVEMTSTAKGFLPPRMTTTQKNAISSPAEGLVVYDTTLHKLCVYTGSAWETITSLSFEWLFWMSLLPTMLFGRRRFFNSLNKYKC